VNDRYDAIIVGGGIGGGAMATVLARAGRSVLVLEKAKVYRDRVRGEWIAPWGVVEAKKLGLYDELIAAGAHHLSVHRTYGESSDPSGVTELPLAMVPDVPGPLCMGHPATCALFQQTARDAGATFLTDVPDVTVTPGSAPSVTYTHEGKQHTAHGRIVIGADGRGSIVRRAAGIELHRDPTHHMFSGLLIEDCHGIDHDAQVFGTEGDVHYLVFPQGNGRARLYIGFPSDQPQRFAGDDGPRRFLETFGQISFPGSEHVANATPAGPCNAYPNEDTWTDVPYADGVVLIGDAAGHNDPIIGQGLSITLTDVRIVSEALLANDKWTPEIFAAYADERRERMRRLRFSAHVSSILMNEFGAEAQARRESVGERAATDPTLRLPQLTAIIGPYAVPDFVFEDSMLEKLFG
jgi:2-polyprenyl-6-methoxyphenol hydroxylase-like FAD-dependent oxidoreductase